MESTAGHPWLVVAGSVLATTVAVVLGVLIHEAPAMAQGVDAEITVPAPAGAAPQIWVDMNTAGNEATAVSTIQRCRRVDAVGALFDVDIVAFNMPQFEKMLVDVQARQTARVR